MQKSYAADVRPLFRPQDIACMAGSGVLLDDPAYMTDTRGDDAFVDHAHARLIYARLTDTSKPMPPDGPWPREKLDQYKSWMDGGFNP